MMEEFPDVREEVLQIVVERERRRLADLQQSKFTREDPKVELKRLMSKINLEELQYSQTMQKS
jgi:hypothetical protein